MARHKQGVPSTLGAKQFRPRYETTFQTVAFLHTYPKSWLWAPSRALATGERIANPKGSQPPQSIIICSIVVGGIAFQGEALMRFRSASSVGSHGTCWGKIPRPPYACDRAYCPEPQVRETARGFPMDWLCHTQVQAALYQSQKENAMPWLRDSQAIPKPMAMGGMPSHS